MRFLIISLIHFYQRFLSPRKGFSCAHHRLHGGHTCSNAVKEIILENGLMASLPKLRQRFQACREASVSLANSVNRADIPCDLPCDIGCDGLDCGGKRGGSCALEYLPCDLWGGSERRSKYSRRQRTVFWLCILFLILGFSYWIYGRGLAVVYVTPHSENAGLSAKLWQRKAPDLRIMIEMDGKKIYSELLHDVELASATKPLKFVLKEAVFDYPQSIELHDARLKVGGDLLVAGEVLERVEQAGPVVDGERFRYKIKRRWSF